MMFKKMKSVWTIHVKVMLTMKTNANIHYGRHGQSVIAKRKPSYDIHNRPKNWNPSGLVGPIAVT